jgi:hypothetical protein
MFFLQYSELRDDQDNVPFEVAQGRIVWLDTFDALKAFKRFPKQADQIGNVAGGHAGYSVRQCDAVFPIMVAPV